MYCNNCGSKIPDDSEYCVECGAKVEALKKQIGKKETVNLSKEKQHKRMVYLVLVICLCATALCVYIYNKGYFTSNHADSSDEIMLESLKEQYSGIRKAVEKSYSYLDDDGKATSEVTRSFERVSYYVPFFDHEGNQIREVYLRRYAVDTILEYDIHRNLLAEYGPFGYYYYTYPKGNSSICEVEHYSYGTDGSCSYEKFIRGDSNNRVDFNSYGDPIYSNVGDVDKYPAMRISDTMYGLMGHEVYPTEYEYDELRRPIKSVEKNFQDELVEIIEVQYDLELDDADYEAILEKR